MDRLARINDSNVGIKYVILLISIGHGVSFIRAQKLAHERYEERKKNTEIS
jgi:hypothetical protein